ncbi:hypothetical protein [Mesorhizobium sp. L2C067A000]|uniref:hypothetical protein n=1 Tax=Mesorhizobium sp. L2C067A000 TaxID=1287106 RepID=UPI0012DD244B|nr:hypothetical protein [Mesorhizobium sp. L2C067A000]
MNDIVDNVSRRAFSRPAKLKISRSAGNPMGEAGRLGRPVPEWGGADIVLHHKNGSGNRRFQAG